MCLVIWIFPFSRQTPSIFHLQFAFLSFLLVEIFLLFLYIIYSSYSFPHDLPLCRHFLHLYLYLQMRHKASNLCLDTMGRKSGEKVGLEHCHGQGGNQVSLVLFFIIKWGSYIINLRGEDLCIIFVTIQFSLKAFCI